MSLSWDGNLLNSPKDIAVDTTILLLSVCAYIPQILDPSAGSGTSGLFGVLFSNAQLSQALLCAAYAWPTARAPVLRQIGDGRLTGVHAFGGVVGLLQIGVQWGCSVAVLLSATIQSQTGAIPWIIAFLHASIVLFPVIAIALPHPSPNHSFGKDIYMALIGFSNIAVALCSIFLQLYFQLQIPGLLQSLILGLQTLVFFLLAIRWSLRLGRRTWSFMWRAPMWWDPTLWMVYEWAFPAANYGLLALGSAVLLVMLSVM